jgi:hypothetical protein
VAARARTRSATLAAADPSLTSTAIRDLTGRQAAYGIISKP